MIELQVINKILQTKDISPVISANIDKSYFGGYEKHFNFIKRHFDKYKNVPDRETFIKEFMDFEFISVNEGWDYLIDKLRENRIYTLAVPIIQEGANRFNVDSRQAVSHIISQLQPLMMNLGGSGIDIISQAQIRYDELEDRVNNPNRYFFSTGFKELDFIIGGLQRGEDLVVLFARTSNLKSYVAEKIAISVWEQGNNVGFFSPEMTPSSVGYRFDTLFKNFNNMGLMRGKDGIERGYKSYIESLSKYNNKFLVTTPSDFDRTPTVSRIGNWIKANNLQMVVIDGLSYMHDERGKRGDNTTTSLTNIAEDLMTLSVELKIPILAIVQANREAAGEDKTEAPTLETIRNSDGISHNASKVISIRFKDGVLEMSIQKNRNGTVGNKLLYSTNVNKGEFTYLPNPKSGLESDKAVEEDIKNQYADRDSVF
jgi:replicative DNA helicase